MAINNNPMIIIDGDVDRRFELLLSLILIVVVTVVDSCCCWWWWWCCCWPFLIVIFFSTSIFTFPPGVSILLAAICIDDDDDDECCTKLFVWDSLSLIIIDWLDDLDKSSTESSIYRVKKKIKKNSVNFFHNHCFEKAIIFSFQKKK